MQNVCFQMELVARFPPSEVENLPVWRHVLLRALSQDARHCVETDIIGLTQKALSNWQNGGHKLGQLDKMVRITSDLSCSGGCNHVSDSSNLNQSVLLVNIIVEDGIFVLMSGGLMSAWCSSQDTMIVQRQN